MSDSLARYEKDLGETVIEFGDKIVRAKARQISYRDERTGELHSDVYIAGNVLTPQGAVEIASKMPVQVYNNMMAAAYRKLGPLLYAKYLSGVPSKLTAMLPAGPSATAAGGSKPR